MAVRKPLTLGADGLVQQIQPSDSLGLHAFFTGSAALPALTLLVGNGVSTITVAPRVTGDALAIGEPILVTPATRLPAGLNISYAVVTLLNTVEIGFSAAVAISGATMAWTIVALR